MQFADWPVRSARRHGIYYGWVLVVELACTELVAWGVLYYSFTIFITPMQRDLGWSRGELTGAFSLALLLSGLAGLPAGRWLDRHGPRALMAAGSLAGVVLTLCWAANSNLLLFYLIWAGIGVVLAAVLYDPAFWVVATWFSRRRGRALTMLTFLAGFSSVVFLPLTNLLVQRQGWRGALVTLAFILAIGTLPWHALLLRRSPHDLDVGRDGDSPAELDAQPGTAAFGMQPGQALRGAAFWWLTLAFMLNALAVITVSVHLVPYLTDRGYGPGFAAGAAGLIGVMALPGRLVFTPLGDRLPRGLVTAVLFLLHTAGLLLLLLVHNTLGVIGFVVLIGTGYGAVTPARAALVADYYGATYYGSIAAILGLFVVGARGVAPVLVGVVRDRTGTYEPIFWLLAALSAVGALAVYIAERSAPNIRRPP